MDPLLKIRLCGGLFIEQDHQILQGFASRKAEALLAYLACNQRPHPRELLADLLWDDRNEKQAAGNLRVLLANLRKLVPAAVAISRQFVLFNPHGDVWVDVVELERALTPVVKQSTQQPLLSPSLVAQLEQGLALYQGEFLAGFAVRDATQFEEWLQRERERLHLLVQQTLRALTVHYFASQQYAAGVPWAQQWVQQDPLDEEANARLITLLANSGQRTAAVAHYRSYHHLLQEELGGEPALETIALYEHILNAESKLPQPPRSPSVGHLGLTNALVPHNLPAQSLSLIGRTLELAQIRERLLNPACRLLTLIGIGGVGKTRLAVEAAQTFVLDPPAEQLFRDGIYLVRLERITTLERLPSALAEALHFTFQGKGEPGAQLLAYLRAKKLLLVMDNFEHLYAEPTPNPTNRPSAAATDTPDYVVEILEHAPGVKILATSRERLNFQSEWLLEISGLPYPQTQQSLPEPHAYPALELFSQRALAIAPDFVAAPQIQAITQICQHLEGLPLGIQLAAAALRTFTCAQIAAEISHNITFLATSLRDLPARQRSLKAVFDYSWALLTAPEQAAFQRLAVFADNFSAEAARQVADVTPSLLLTLIDKSLLNQVPLAQEHQPLPRTPYYKFHRALHQYAAEKLATTPHQQEELRRRHSEYYSQFIQRQEDALQSLNMAQALRLIELELENVRTGWNYAVDTAQLADLEWGLSGLATFYLLRGPLPEAQAMLEQTIAKLRALIAAEQTVQTQDLLERLLVEKAMFLNEQGFYDQAIATAQEVIERAEQSGHSKSQTLGYFHWGAALSWQGNYAAAQQILQQALTLAQGANLRAIEAACHRRLGIICLYQGDYTAGRMHQEISVQICHAIEDRVSEIKAYTSLAMVYLYSGDYVSAKQHYEQCLAGYRAFGDRPATSIALNNLGAVFAHLGDYPAARAYYEECLAIKQELGDRQGEGLARANLSLLWHLMRDQEQAVGYAQQALVISQELGNRDTEAFARNCLAHGLAALQQWPEAIEQYQQALALRRALEQRHQALEPLAGLASTYLAQGALNEALPYAEAILADLSDKAFTGVVELLRVYLACYQVLKAMQDPRALPVLTLAHQVLQERAAKLNDPVLRRSFLENVLAHHAVLVEYQKVHRHPPTKTNKRKAAK
ncbi:MAG: tetratricopeptide repeat protein [Caldilineaceae bacterium]